MICTTFKVVRRLFVRLPGLDLAAAKRAACSAMVYPAIEMVLFGCWLFLEFGVECCDAKGKGGRMGGEIGSVVDFGSSAL